MVVNAVPPHGCIPELLRIYNAQTHPRLCGCAGRSYSSYSTSQVLQSHGNGSSTRTRRVHPASSWHQSRTGMSLPRAPAYLPNLVHSDGERTVNERPVGLTRVELGAASAGRSVPTAQPASSMLVVRCRVDACVQPEAAGLRLESRRRRHIRVVLPRSCESDHDCSPEWPRRAARPDAPGAPCACAGLEVRQRATAAAPWSIVYACEIGSSRRANDADRFGMA